MDITYKKITKQDWDCCLLISGDEGISKSTLNLHILDYWYNLKNGRVTKEEIKHISLDKFSFVENLKDCFKYDCSIFDEAGEISNKRTMSSFNVLLSQAYQVIRGDNLLSIFTIPSIFDLDPFFTKRRARGLFHVYKRGRVAFYSKERLRKIIEINQYRMLKRVNVISPTFRDTFSIYKGVLKEPYDTKKAEKMKEVRLRLYEKVQKENNFKSDVSEYKEILRRQFKGETLSQNETD